MNFYAFIAPAATSDALALRWPLADHSIDLTFGQLARQVEAARQALLSHNIQAGDVGMVALPVSPQAMVVTLALMAEGAIPLVPPARMTLAQWRLTRKKYKIKAIVADQNPPWKIRLLCLLSGLKLLRITTMSVSSSFRPPVEVTDQQAALITFSSGSTGRPKAIERSHAVLTQQHRAILELFPAQAGQLDFLLFPNILLHNLAAGISTVLPRLPGFQLDQLQPDVILSQIQQEGVHTLTGNVFYFTKLVNYAVQHGIKLPAVEAVGVGGSPVPELLLRQLQQVFLSASIYVIYGSSEAEPIAVRKFTKPQDPLLGYAVGEIHPWLEWKLVSADPREKDVGELWVKGPHVVVPFGKEWFATGDIGYVQDNQLVLTARRGNEAVVGGKQHYQLEHYLQHLPGVSRAAAVVNGPAFDISYEGVTTIHVVRASLEQVIAPHRIKTIRLIDQLPVDRRHHSKILYHQLPK